MSDHSAETSLELSEQIATAWACLATDIESTARALSAINRIALAAGSDSQIDVADVELVRMKLLSKLNHDASTLARDLEMLTRGEDLPF